MKILIMTGGFFPGETFGGPPVSVDNFCSLLQEYDCYIITSDHDNCSKERYKSIQYGWNKRANSQVMYLSDKEYFSIKSLCKLSKQINPDWIYLQSLFQDLAFLGLVVAKKLHKKVMLAPRGELCKGAFKKKYKKIPYIFLLRLFGLLKNVHFQSTSEEETEAIHRYLKVPYERIHFLTNIPSIPPQKNNYIDKKSGKAKFVFLSRIHPKKNLKFAIECINELKGEIIFDVYGPKEDSLYWDECQALANTFPKNISFNYCGLVSHDSVFKIFNEYDAFVFPTYSENYGHVIAESLLSGCTVVISDQTPWSDINDFSAGWALPLNNKSGFVNTLQSIVDWSNDDKIENNTQIKKYLSEKLKISELHDEYIRAFK